MVRGSWLLLVSVVAAAVVGYLQRGVVWGCVPALAVALGSAVALVLVGRHLARRAAGRVLALEILACLLIPAALWYLLQPPSAAEMIHKYVTTAPLLMEDARAFHDWGRDRTSAVRFKTNEDGVKAVLKALKAVEDNPPRDARADAAFYHRGDFPNAPSFAPQWWDIEKAERSTTWTGETSGWTRAEVRMRYDPRRSVMYLEFFF